jgi:hypothetical protein
MVKFLEEDSGKALCYWSCQLLYGYDPQKAVQKSKIEQWDCLRLKQKNTNQNLKQPINGKNICKPYI